MNQEEFEVLATGAYERLIQDNLDQDPAHFALHQKEKNFSPSVLATQLKYLQKSREKLPTFFENQCLFLPKAFEQASSELTASSRKYQGKRCLDLTCGMGVDTLYFSKQFDEVIALEPDPLLAQLTQFNLGKMGVSNVHIRTQRAEEFLKNPPKDSFDLIYIDPDRRGANGKRAVRLEDCQPDILQLYPQLKSLGKRIVIKASPLLDIAEAIRLFPTLQGLTILSVKNEVKELLLDLAEDWVGERATEVQVFRQELVQSYRFTDSFATTGIETAISPDTKYIYEPDVAFYKARSTAFLFTQYFSHLAGAMNHPEGYFFSDTFIEPAGFPGRVFETIATLAPQTSKLKRYLRAHQIRQIHVSKRHFPETAVKIARKLSVTAGGNDYLLFTEFPGKDFRAFHTRRMY